MDPSGPTSIAVPRLELTVEREAAQPCDRTVVIEGDLCRLGANEQNDVVINDPSVSRFHCRLWRADGSWRISDERSLNGTRLNKIAVRDADVPLPQCTLEIGASVVRVRELGSDAVDPLPALTSFGSIVGESIPMRRMFGVLDKVAKSEVNVLIQGESGTGKELVATEIVTRGPRADGPFVVVDCGAVSPNLIESELFGHVRGAFTGAERDREGAFAEAHGGTVFLDEIGELPLDMQPKLLRALEAREVRRVGETKPRKVDVRVIAATNRRLESEINHGRFREDLYFRLSVVTLRVPPLRQRLEDFELLVNHFLEQLSATDMAHLFGAELLNGLKGHDWPGNVRELRNFVERSVILEDTSPARDSAAPPVGGASGAEPDLDVSFTAAKEELVADFERRYLTALLKWAGGNVSRAARRAGMDRMYLHRLMQRHRLRGASFKE